MSKYDSDPIPVSESFSATKRLHHSVVINGRDANVSVEIAESSLPGETASEFADRTALLACRELDTTTEVFKAFFNTHRSVEK